MSNSEMKPLVTVVTGASRGIGLAIVESLASGSTPLKLYAASRAGKDTRLKATSGTSIRYVKLDVGDRGSISSLAERIKRDEGRLDCLINNAGINVDHERDLSLGEQAKQTLDINYRGTLEMCQAFLPLLTADTGRIVNVSSVASHLSSFSRPLAQRFRSAKTLDEIDGPAQEYLESADAGSARKDGWASPYCVSKALINGLTAVLAKQNAKTTINCCCPGWVDTDMGVIVGSSPSKRPENGATIPVRLALGDIGNVSGKFWENPSIASTANGRVSEW